MEKTILTKNIVVNGRYNPGSFDKYFFIKNGIISEDEFNAMKHPPVFNVVNVHVATGEFELTVNPTQVAIYLIDPANNTINIGSKLKRILELSDSSNFTTFGANFNWVIELNSKQELHDTSKSFFFNENTPIIGQYFNTNDAHYGFYASKDIFGLRLKLDVKPVRGIFHLQATEQKDGIQFSFNFHCDENTLSLDQFLNSFKEYDNESTKMISAYNLE